MRLILFVQLFPKSRRKIESQLLKKYATNLRLHFRNWRIHDWQNRSSSNQTSSSLFHTYSDFSETFRNESPTLIVVQVAANIAWSRYYGSHFFLAKHLSTLPLISCLCWSGCFVLGMRNEIGYGSGKSIRVSQSEVEFGRSWLQRFPSNS